MTIELGDRVKDRITGYTGIVNTKSEYLNGCRRFGVQSEKVDKDGRVPDSIYFDEPDLTVIKKGVHAIIPIGTVATPKAPARAYAGGPARSGDHSRR